MTKKIELSVSGMKCGGCESTVKKTLTETTGVISVDAKHADNWVSIEFDDAELEEDSIIDIIEKAGFTVND